MRICLMGEARSGKVSRGADLCLAAGSHRGANSHEENWSRGEQGDKLGKAIWKGPAYGFG